MAEVSELKLYGMWASSFSKRVELALKLKGIPYEYIEEDLYNKSESLLQYNPVHKKVPVLVHNGIPIAESLVILEYIDEFWNNTPRLLPEDPYERAKVRFWANFFDQKLIPSSRPAMLSKGEEQQKAIKELYENLRVLDEGMAKDFPGKSPFFNGETPGFLDIVMGTSACNHLAIKEVVGGAEWIDPHKNPLLFSWVTALKDHPVVKETLPTHHKLVEYLQKMRAFHSATTA